MIRMAMAMAWKRQSESWAIDLIETEAAFLYADFESSRLVYAEWPEGKVELGCITLEERKSFALTWQNLCMEGFDVPRLFMSSLCKYWTQNMRMTQSHVNPNMYYWIDAKTEVILMAVVHVEGVTLIGQKTRTEKMIWYFRLRKSWSDIWESGMSTNQMKTIRFTLWQVWKNWKMKLLRHFKRLLEKV